MDCLDLFVNEKHIIAHIDENGNFSSESVRITATTLADLNGSVDTYISMNPFKSGKRVSENVSRFAMLYADIDVAHGNCTDTEWAKQSVLYALETDVFGVTVPTPTFIIDSGRGLYLWWVLEAGEKRAELWSTVERQLVYKLLPYGADTHCTDAARVFRVPGTVNSKNGRTVTVLRATAERYTLDDIVENYGFDDSFVAPVATADSKAKKIGGGKSKKIGGAFSAVNFKAATADTAKRNAILEARIRDIYRIAEAQNWDSDDRCKKEVMCFLVRHMALENGLSSDEAARLALGLNARFERPLPIDFVLGRTASAETAKKRGIAYNYKSDTLAKLLLDGNTEVFCENIITRAEALRRKSVRNKAAYEKRIDYKRKSDELHRRRYAIASLILKGKKAAYISRALHISRATYYRELPQAMRIAETIFKNRACLKNSASILSIYNNSFFPFSSPSSLTASKASPSAPPDLLPYFHFGGFATVEAVTDRRRYQGMIDDDLGGSASLTA